MSKKSWIINQFYINQKQIVYVAYSSIIIALANYIPYFCIQINMDNKQIPRPRPKDGFFSTISELKTQFQFHKKTHKEFKNIPVIFQHCTHRNHSNGAFLFFVKPQMQSNTFYGQIMRRAILKQKQLDKHYVDSTSIMISEKKTDKRVPIHFHPDQKGKAIQEIYQESKDEEKFLHYQYQFAYEQVQGDFPREFFIAAFVILSLPILSLIGMYQLYNWTSQKLSNLSENLSSFFTSEQHKFKYKQKFSLTERKRKCEILRQNQPENIPIILEKHFKSKLPDLPFMKFIIKSQYNYLQLCTKLRAKILKSSANQAKGNSKSKESIFFIIDGKLPNHQTAMEQIYHKFKDYDGMLYISYQQQESI